MDAAVLISGLSIYLLATVVYMRDAYRKAPLWAWATLLLPPIALVYYTIYWRRSWPLFTVHTVGLALTVLGGVFLLRAAPAQFDNTYLADLRDAVAPASLNRPLDIEVEEFAGHQSVGHYIGRIDGLIGGRLFGEPIAIETVELVDGALRFKKGNGFFPQKEVAIYLGITAYEVDGEWELDLNPTSENVPTIHVSEYQARQGKIKTQVIDGGYWLELHLSDRRQNQLSGFVRLLLPGDKKDFIAGNFESYTSRLRYVGDDVDRFHDSNDTVEYVAGQHLASRFKKAVKKVSFIDTHYMAHVAIPHAETIAELHLIDGSVHTIPLALFKGEQGWTVDTHSTDDLQLAIETLVDHPPAAGPKAPPPEPDIFSGGDLTALIGKRIKVVSTEGKVRKGLLSGIEQSQLVLQQMVGKGSMAIYLPERLVDQVVVLN